MKKYICLVLSVVLLFLAGCNNASFEDYPEENRSVRMKDGEFVIAYEGESYVKIGETTKISARFFTDRKTFMCQFTSDDEKIATVDENGVVTGISAGTATIRAAVNPKVYIDFYVTVLPEDISDELMLAVKANNSNIFVRENLGIGAGEPVYYRDIYGSVSKLLYNENLEINKKFYEEGTANTAHTNGKRSDFGFDLEYITVHYTGNMNVGATAHNNAEYFAYVNEVSVHYVTGNDGVYQSMDDGLISWNAGDRTSGLGGLKWKATGVMAPTDGSDVAPVWGVTEDKKFTINGEVTKISIPSRTGSKIKYHGTTFEINGVEYPIFSDLGLPWKIVDGEYYMGNTWWCFRSSTAGCICGNGGDYNSISIESAVNPETDLWYTWQKTAQLVAKLLVDNNLDNTRVTGHNMWTQKDCPQPFLENNLELWKEFLEMVYVERELYENFSDCEYSMKILSGKEVTTDKDKDAKLEYGGKTYTYTMNPGRVIPDEEAHVVLYQVTVKKADGTTESIKLASAVNKK